MNERSNRTRKAQAIAAVLAAIGVTPADALALPDHVWALAAETGWQLAHDAGDAPARTWTDASPATRREVAAMLADSRDAVCQCGAAVVPVPAASGQRWVHRAGSRSRDGRMDATWCYTDGSGVHRAAPVDGRPLPDPGLAAAVEQATHDAAAAEWAARHAADLAAEDEAATWPTATADEVRDGWVQGMDPEAVAANLRQHETDDVFARIAAPHTGPQDPDAPVRNTEFVRSPAPEPETTPCATCGHPIFANSLGGWTHYGNTTASPSTCYRPDGSQAQAAPADGRPHPQPASEPRFARCSHGIGGAHQHGNGLCHGPGREDRNAPNVTPRVSAAGVADLHPAARHTLACLAGGGRCQPGTPC